MGCSISVLVIGLEAFLACKPCHSAKPQALHKDEVVTVIAEPKYYVSGAIDGKDMHFFNKPEPKRMWQVDGFIFEIVRPTQYAGQIIGMHHDGVLASGDPYTLWEVGRRYEFGIEKDLIGKLSFGPCSLHGTRKLLPEIKDERQKK